MRKVIYLLIFLLILLSLSLTIFQSVGYCLFIFVFLITLAMHLQTSSYKFGYMNNEEYFKYMDIENLKLKSLYPIDKQKKISYYQYLATNILTIITIIECLLFIVFLLFNILNLENSVIFKILILTMVLINIIVLISHVWIGLIYKLLLKNKN